MYSEVSVEVENLSKCYQIYDRPRDRLLQMLPFAGLSRARDFWALRDVSFRVRKGDALGIIGRNGSGKSTLLQMISGTLTPTTGQITAHGKVAALLELGSGFNPEFTGRENVYLNAALLGLGRAEVDARFDEIADFANIGTFIDQPTKTYSSGMLVRLAFAVSVCVEPEILIIDEALAVGDASFQFKCLGRLEVLANKGTTLLFVSHDMSMVKRFCNSSIYLDGGLLKAEGPPETVAEMYLLDMRDEQRRWASGGAVPVVRKKGLNEARIAFGTDEGTLTFVGFTSTDTHYSSFAYGDTIEIIVNYRLSKTILFPNISVTIQEARLLVISGKNFNLPISQTNDDWHEGSIAFRFPALLASGKYHVTIKLMNGLSEETSLLIDKQVGVLNFDMVTSGSDNFLGIVDLGIKSTTLPGRSVE